LTSLDVKLMMKDQYLGFQRGPRPEQSDQRQPDQAASFSHKAEALRDLASVASRIRFSTGTGAWIERPVFVLERDPYADIISAFDTLKS
jgi:hypothetical protein